jgi:hypothetical protein
MFVARSGPKPAAGTAAARNLTWQPGRVSATQRAELLGQKSATIWLTGPAPANRPSPASWSSNLSREAVRRL